MTDCRLPRLVPAALDPAQAELVEEIAGGRRAQGPQRFRLRGDDGALEGPFNAFLLQPPLGRSLQALGAAVRYDTTLTDRVRELAILVVATRWGSLFERYAHEAVGSAQGLSAAELNGLRRRDYSVFADPAERVTAQTVDALAFEDDLDDAQYAAALDVVGRPQLFELLTLVGYYATLALQLRVFRVELPDGVDPAPLATLDGPHAARPSDAASGAPGHNDSNAAASAATDPHNHTHAKELQ